MQTGVVTLREAGQLLAVMPVMIARSRRGPALSVRFDFHPGDAKFVREKSKWRFLPVNQLSPPLSIESGNLRGGYLADPTANGPLIWRHLAAALGDIPGWTVAVFPVPMEKGEERLAPFHDGPLTGFVRSSDRRFYSCERVAPWDQLVQKMSHNARKSVNRAVRRAEEAGLRCVVFDRSDNLNEGFRNLAAIAQVSWKEAGRDKSPVHLPYTERQRSFYEGLGSATTRLRAAVFCLVQPDQCRAAALTFANGNCLTACIICYAPEIASAYPGRLLVKAIVDWAVTNGIERLDFNATDSWVEPFSDLVEEYGQLVAFNRGLYGRLLNAAARRLAT